MSAPMTPAEPYDAGKRPSLVDRLREQERRDADRIKAQRKGKGPYAA